MAARDGVTMSLPVLGGDMVWSFLPCHGVVVVAVRGGVMVTWCDGGGHSGGDMVLVLLLPPRHGVVMVVSHQKNPKKT